MSLYCFVLLCQHLGLESRAAAYYIFGTSGAGRCWLYCPLQYVCWYRNDIKTSTWYYFGNWTILSCHEVEKNRMLYCHGTMTQWIASASQDQGILKTKNTFISASLVTAHHTHSRSRDSLGEGQKLDKMHDLFTIGLQLTTILIVR